MIVPRHHRGKVLTGVDYKTELSQYNKDKAAYIEKQYDEEIQTNAAAEAALAVRKTGDIIYHPVSGKLDQLVASVNMPDGKIRHFTFDIVSAGPFTDNYYIKYIGNGDGNGKIASDKNISLQTSLSEFVENELVAAKIALLNTKNGQENKNVESVFSRIRIQDRQSVESDLRSQDSGFVTYIPMEFDKRGQYVDVSIKDPGLVQKIGHLRFELKNNAIFRAGQSEPIPEASIQKHIEEFVKKAKSLFEGNQLEGYHFKELSKKLKSYEKKVKSHPEQQRFFNTFNTYYKQIENDILEGRIQNTDELKSKISDMNIKLKELDKRHADIHQSRKFHVAPKFTNAIRHAASKIKDAIRPNKHSDQKGKEAHPSEEHHRRKR